MSNTKTLILSAALIAALVTVFLQHRQNTTLRAELTSTREEKARMESQASTSAKASAEESAQKRIQELESEVTRLRGSASRAARAESENAHLKTLMLSQRTPQTSGAVGSAAANSDSLAEYVGAGVQPPANLDPAYSKDGLVGAIQLAAQKAGLTPRKIAVDDSEFPFLLGVVSEPSEWEKLKAQLKSLDGYAYNGSVGDDNKNVFSITPHQAYPTGTDQTINRRMTLRLQIFYDKFAAAQK